MLEPDEWKVRVIAGGITLCPACESTEITLGATAVGTMTIHQEYICEHCQHEFSGLFALVTCYESTR